MSYNKFRDNYDWKMMNFNIHKINFNKFIWKDLLSRNKKEDFNLKTFIRLNIKL